MNFPGHSVPADRFLDHTSGAGRLVRQGLLVATAIAFITVAAHVRIPMWPVPVTMQTFAILTVGAVYGPTLAGASLLAYLGLGALGVAVFTGNGEAQGGLAYMVGPTGGYLVGFLLAAIVVGWLARRGWDRTTIRLGAALLAGNAIIYLLGLAWMAALFASSNGIAWVLKWGIINFLPGDLLKICLALAVIPLVHKGFRR